MPSVYGFNKMLHNTHFHYKQFWRKQGFSALFCIKAKLNFYRKTLGGPTYFLQNYDSDDHIYDYLK